MKQKGSVRWRSTRTDDPLVALERAKKIRRDLTREAEGLPLLEATSERDPKELVDEALAWRLKKKKCGPDHKNTFKSRVSFFFVGAKSIDLAVGWFERKLDELSKKLVWDRRPSHKGQKRPISPQSMNQYIRHLRTFFNTLIKMKLWDKNPALEIEEFEEGDSVIDYRAFRPEEILVFFASVPLERIAAYLMCGADSIRRAELQRLKVGDLELRPEGGVEPNVRILRETAKTKKRHTIALHPQLVPVLKLLTFGKASENPVFDTVPRSDTFRKDVLAAGLKLETRDGILTSTSLRKFLETELAGVIPDTLRKKITRRSPGDVSEQHYIRHDLPKQAAALGLLKFLPPERLAEIEARLAEIEPKKPSPSASAPKADGSATVDKKVSAASQDDEDGVPRARGGVPVSSEGPATLVASTRYENAAPSPESSASANSATSACVCERATGATFTTCDGLKEGPASARP
jgi:integrase